MAIINFSGFEAGDASDLTVASLGGTASVQSTTKRTGNYALRVNPTTTGIGNLNISRVFSGVLGPVPSGGDRYLRFYFLYKTKPAANSEEICSMLSAATKTARHLYIRIDSGGHLLAYFNTTLLATGTTVLASDTWYRIELKRLAGSPTSVWELLIDGVVEIGGTATLNATTGVGPQLGKSVNRNGQSVDFYYDDVMFSDSAYPGAGQCSILVPVGAGNYTGWTGSFADVDEIPQDGATTLLTAASNAASTFDMTPCASATPAVSGTIKAVKTSAYAKASSPSASQGVRTRRGGSTDTDATTSTLGTTFTELSQIHETCPATSAAWTVSDIDAAEAGIRRTAGTATAQCTAIHMMVDYDPSGGGGATFIAKSNIVSQAVKTASYF